MEANEMLSQQEINRLNKMQAIHDEMDGDLVESFLTNLLRNYLELENNGCFRDDTPQTARTKIAIRVTAENIRIMKMDQSELENARRTGLTI